MDESRSGPERGSAKTRAGFLHGRTTEGERGLLSSKYQPLCWSVGNIVPT